jgi:hypothetical protein
MRRDRIRSVTKCMSPERISIRGATDMMKGACRPYVPWYNSSERLNGAWMPSMQPVVRTVLVGQALSQGTPRPWGLMPCRLIPLPLDCLDACMPVTVPRWTRWRGLAWVLTNCQAFVPGVPSHTYRSSGRRATLGLCAITIGGPSCRRFQWLACGRRLRLSTQADSPALMLDAPQSESSATRLSECMYACDSAQMDSVAGLRLRAHQLSTCRLGVHGRLCVHFDCAPKSSDSPALVVDAPPPYSSVTRLSECLGAYDRKLSDQSSFALE